MRRHLMAILVLALLAHTSALTAFAQAGAAAAPTSGARSEFLFELAGMEKRFVDLAERIPAEKYTWRPGEGVRSISEVLLHVAGANFNIPRLIGTQPPAGFQPKGFDTSTTEKAKVSETVKQSFAHFREAVTGLADAGVENPLKLFGRENTYRGVMLFAARHMGEHLGQLIAYARINGVVPPWTEEQQQRQRQQQQAPAAKK